MLIPQQKILDILAELRAPATIAEVSKIFLSKTKSKKPKAVLTKELRLALENAVEAGVIIKYHDHYFNIDDTKMAMEQIEKEDELGSVSNIVASESGDEDDDYSY